MENFVIECPTCKKQLDSGVRFCPHDGTPLTETAPGQATRTPPTTSGQTPATRELELPVVVGGRYRLVEKRGGGGMAKVYRALDVTLEREVAVKLINPDLRNESEFDSRFQREARIASQLNDPHIVVVHDFGLDAQHGPFLVMEYLQGQSLRERLQAEGPLPYRAGIQLSAQLLLALIHAHGKDIVHRDIKPDNIFLLNQSGVRLHVRVLDFGIARIYRHGEPGKIETLTNPGSVLGTPRYMSPEQLAGQPVDARSDLYSAALVIHEALTGQLPYVSGKKFNELCPEAPVVLQELLDQCLRPNPAERPASAVEMYLRLQELGKASGILLLPPGAMDKLIASRRAAEPTVEYKPPTPTRWWQRRPVKLSLAAFLAVAALVLLVGILVYKRQPIDSQHETLLGVRIGDPREVAVEKLQLLKWKTFNPWSEKHVPHYLGNVLHAEDLQLPAEDLDRLDILLTADEKICVICFDDQVRAVVAHRGQTGRGLKITGARHQIDSYFGEQECEDCIVSTHGEGAKKVEIRRFLALGIGIEINSGKVIAITLFPSVRVAAAWLPFERFVFLPALKRPRPRCDDEPLSALFT